jgi:hypothetical protein
VPAHRRRKPLDGRAQQLSGTGLPEVPLVTTPDRVPVPALVTARGVLTTADQPAAVHDLGPQLSATTAEMRAWSQNLAAAAALESSIAALAGTHRRPDGALQACLEQMRQAREAAQELVLSVLRHTQALRSTHQGRPAPSPAPPLAQYAHHWALAVARMATHTRTVLYNRLSDRLHDYHDPPRQTAAEPCPHCTAPRSRLLFTSAIAGVPNRVAVSCPRCGPLAEHAQPGHTIHITPPQTLQPGTTTHASIHLDVPEHRDQDPGLLLTQLRPRSSGLGPLDVDQRQIHAPTQVNVPVSAPANLTPELHRLWVLFAHRFQISIAQIRVACLPQQ